MNDITRSGTAQLFNESHDKMLAKIRRELREHEYYGLANDRIEWLLNEVDDLREASDEGEAFGGHLAERDVSGTAQQASLIDTCDACARWNAGPCPHITQPSGTAQPCGDPFAQRAGSRTHPRKGFWYAGPTYLRPGIFYTRRRLLAVSEWLTRPRYKWNVRGYGKRWT